MSGHISVWQSEYVHEYVLHTKLFSFLFITQIILIVFFVVKEITYMMYKILSIIIVLLKNMQWYV